MLPPPAGTTSYIASIFSIVGWVFVSSQLPFTSLPTSQYLTP